MAGKFDKTETRGYMWVKDKMDGGTIKIKEKNLEGEVQINSSTGNIKAVFGDNGTVSIKISVAATGTINNINVASSEISNEEIKVLEDAFARSVKDEIKAAVKKNSNLKTDAFGFSMEAYRQSPRKWTELKKRKEKDFSELVPEIDVKTELSGSDALGIPLIGEFHAK